MIDKIILNDVKSILSQTHTNSFQNRRILVTGGGGFLGSYLCDVFVKIGADVTCLDDFSTGLTENINHLVRAKNFHIIEGNVSVFTSEDKYDFILHFASRASPDDYQLSPVETLLANSEGSHRVLELARRQDSTILFASSSETYGDPLLIPTPERYWGNVNPVGVRSCYDEGKRFGEALFMAYHRQYLLDTRIARIHNTYGPRLRADGAYARALSRFVLQALKNQDLTIYGDGTQTRSFSYVTDTVRGVLLMLSCQRCAGEVVNIGGTDEIRILELADIIKRISKSKSNLTFSSLPKDDPKRRRPDIRKAQKLLKWQPQIGLEEGLKRTISWFRSFCK